METYGGDGGGNMLNYFVYSYVVCDDDENVSYYDFIVVDGVNIDRVLENYIYKTGHYSFNPSRIQKLDHGVLKYENGRFKTIFKPLPDSLPRKSSSVLLEEV
jgi:hypothetical protein